MRIIHIRLVPLLLLRSCSHSRSSSHSRSNLCPNSSSHSIYPKVSYHYIMKERRVGRREGFDPLHISQPRVHHSTLLHSNPSSSSPPFSLSSTLLSLLHSSRSKGKVKKERKGRKGRKEKERKGRKGKKKLLGSVQALSWK